MYIAPEPQHSEIHLLASSFQPNSGIIRIGEEVIFKAETLRATKQADPVIYLKTNDDQYCIGTRLTALNDNGEDGDETPFDGHWTATLDWPAKFGPGKYQIYLVLEFDDLYLPRYGFNENIEVNPAR
jgi:hypothetical protein